MMTSLIPETQSCQPDASWTVDALLRRRAQQYGDRPFVRMRHETDWLSFAQLLEAAEVTARKLSVAGVRADDVVPVFAATSREHLATWFATAMLGAADMPINIKYRGESLAAAMRLAGASVAVADATLVPRLLEVLPELPGLRVIVVIDGRPTVTSDAVRVIALTDIDGDDRMTLPGGRFCATGSVLLTSGTTGPSKGVMMPHAQIITHSFQAVGLVSLTEDDVYYSAHPLFHMAGKFSAICAALQAGAQMVLAPEFEPARWLADIRAAKATVTLGHGPLLEMIFRQPARPGDADTPLRAIAAGGVPLSLAEPFEERFGCRLAETYGMSELNVVAFSRHTDVRPAGSAGRVDDRLYDVRIVDPDTDMAVPAGSVGEITVRPKVPWTTSLGYLRMPERTVEAWRNLWMHTSDMGYLDEDGYLFFAERTGERIRRRAENISAYEIETVLSKHASVAESAAVGIPSELEGDDDIKVYVVVRAGAQVDCLELLRHCALSLPPFMVPRYFELVDELPRTPTAKIQKALLRSRGVTPDTWDRRVAGIDLREFLGQLTHASLPTPAGT